MKRVLLISILIVSVGLIYLLYTPPNTNSYPSCSAGEHTTPCVFKNSPFICEMGVYQRCCPGIDADEFFENKTCKQCAESLKKKCKTDTGTSCISIITKRDGNGTASESVEICDQLRMILFKEFFSSTFISE